MKASLKLFATLSKYLPPEARKTSCLELELAPGTTLHELLAQCGIPPEHCALLLINGVFVPPPERDSRVLSEGDIVAIWPPVGGG
jgi:molybdopterin synthase sulfur carrier subunit